MNNDKRFVTEKKEKKNVVPKLLFLNYTNCTISFILKLLVAKVFFNQILQFFFINKP